MRWQNPLDFWPPSNIKRSLRFKTRGGKMGGEKQGRLNLELPKMVLRMEGVVMTTPSEIMRFG